MSSPRTFALLALMVLPATPVIAQPLGTFRWQLQPYCNVLVVTVTQQGGIYTLDGTDDRCGASQAASAVGVAFMNPAGNVGFGITLVVPNGTPVHVEATINLSSLNGTWRDSAGNSGSFVFTPGPGIGGALRPVPTTGLAAGSIIATHIAAGAVGNTHLAANAVTGANVADGSLTSDDLADGPRTAFAGGDNQNITISAFPTATLVRSVVIAAPAAGKVVVHASGFFEFNSASLDNARCEITNSLSIINNDHAMYAREHSADAVHYVPFSTTRGFDVTAGSNTFNLLCDRISGTVSLWRSFMTATYTRQ